jgi:hypothetical protein
MNSLYPSYPLIKLHQVSRLEETALITNTVPRRRNSIGDKMLSEPKRVLNIEEAHSVLRNEPAFAFPVRRLAKSLRTGKGSSAALLFKSKYNLDGRNHDAISAGLLFEETLLTSNCFAGTHIN